MSDADDYVATIIESELQEGKMKLVSTEGTPLLFIKQQGKIHVIDNRCPHMGCGFSGGTLENSVIVCPCHDWRFNLETGEYEEEPSYKLKKYEWKVEAGKIWVKLEF
jgi:3-phenylpropionate/trans-cinnamate dioxygenase ferredoxin subunit